MKQKLFTMMMLAVMLVLFEKGMRGQIQPGDIAFIAANADGDDDFAFVTFVDISVGTSIYFTDNEWNGTAFTDLNEGELTWTNGGTTLSAGSVIVFTDPGSSGSVNVGSISGSGWNLGASDEWFYALLSAPATSYGTTPIFLAAMATDAGSGWLTGTGLVEGTNAIDFNDDADGYKYIGVRAGQTSFFAYLPVIMNLDNWQIESSNGENILPIATTAFTISGGGNTPPSITNIANTPTLPNSSQTITVSADVTDTDGTISGVELHWGTVSGDLNTTIAMSVSSGDTYTTDTEIPAQAAETTIYYEIQATDDGSEVTTTSEQSYQVLSDEPSSHVTSFIATANSATAITVSWSDSDASNYLVKGSALSYVDIIAPVDGVAEPDDALVQNVTLGIQSCQFTSLSPSTTYYFKVYPYNGATSTINYKTDGSVPEAFATTEEAPVAPNVFISEYIEGTSNNKAIEIVNATGGSVNLSDYKVNLAGNGGGWGGSPLTLSGTLHDGEVYIIANSSANSIILERSNVTSGVTYFNGDDAIGLFYQDVLIDVIGTPDLDPGTSWSVAGVSTGTVEHTLVRKLSVTTGNTDWTVSAGTDATDSEWIVFDQDHFFNLGVFGTGWKGITDNDWATATNWDVQIPDATVNVLVSSFASNMPTITSSANCKDIIIESTSSSNASLLGDNNLTVNGSVSVERYITGGVWHDLSASTQSQTVNNLYFDGTPDVWLNTYDETDNTRNPITLLSTPLPSGAGFEIWVEAGNNVTVNYNGALQTTDVTLTTGTSPPLSFSGADPLGYNLIGNPFASPLDWDLGTWALSNMTDGIWVWNGSTYLDWVGGTGSLTDGIIPMGQGFFVQTTSAAASITIPLDARVHNSQAYYKGPTSVPDHMWIKAIKGEKNDQLTVVFAEDATEGYDNGRDSRKMLAFNGHAPQIYALEQDEKFGIDGLPTLTEAGRTVNVMYHVGESGEQQLLANLESLPDVKVLLEDAQTGIVQDLNENPEYLFEAAQGDNPNRFTLYFNPTPTMISNLGDHSDVHVYAFQNEIYVRSEGEAVNASKTIWVYDMYGQVILNTVIPPSTLTKIPLDVRNTPVIVKVVGTGSVVTSKVVIN
ncbi:MAG: lamin tail domain-containing protein [Bacteroidales bacterium]|nr:lamin tail domain-containing protein [Bacteroidales bacterium]